MSSRRAEELLYDSEATLRLVDNVLGELCEPRPSTIRVEDTASPAMLEIRRILTVAHAELVDLLGSVRQSRRELESRAANAPSFPPTDPTVHLPDGSPDEQDFVRDLERSLATTEDRLAWLARCLDPKNLGLPPLRGHLPPAASPDSTTDDPGASSNAPARLKKPA